jgi:hypothetical protein
MRWLELVPNMKGAGSANVILIVETWRSMVNDSSFDQVFMIFRSITRQMLVEYFQICHENQHIF